MFFGVMKSLYLEIGVKIKNSIHNVLWRGRMTLVKKKQRRMNSF
jgi:hypothetical protein